ncbi:MAG: hypothetical protein RLZZ403_822 [Pseudomonadota bacterium]|jgi:uncharacterized protein YgfB (UPF0149 family)
MSILHAEVARDLDAASAEMQAAEAHGCLCGALCALDEYTFEQWLAEISPDVARADALGLPGSPLRLLFDSTGESLRSDAMEFSPLLPDDDESLVLRADALAQWAQGFLYGLATGDIGRNPALPGTVKEILGDFAEISRATLSADADSADAVAGDEADEEAYVELHEFMRAGAQLVYDELLPLRRP